LAEATSVSVSSNPHRSANLWTDKPDGDPGPPHRSANLWTDKPDGDPGPDAIHSAGETSVESNQLARKPKIRWPSSADQSCWNQLDDDLSGF